MTAHKTSWQRTRPRMSSPRGQFYCPHGVLFSLIHQCRPCNGKEDKIVERCNSCDGNINPLTGECLCSD